MLSMALLSAVVVGFTVVVVGGQGAISQPRSSLQRRELHGVPPPQLWLQLDCCDKPHRPVVLSTPCGTGARVRDCRPRLDSRQRPRDASVFWQPLQAPTATAGNRAARAGTCADPPCHACPCAGHCLEPCSQRRCPRHRQGGGVAQLRIQHTVRCRPRSATSRQGTRGSGVAPLRRCAS